MRAKLPYKKRKKRLGRGPSSGHGKTSTKGHKGQLARSGQGKGKFPGFEGGQFPLIRRIPKVGFTSRFRKEFALLNLNQIERSGESKLDLKKIIELRLISRLKDGLKILGEGDLKRAVHIEAHAFSQSAKRPMSR